jgi:hypothetical protein
MLKNNDYVGNKGVIQYLGKLVDQNNGREKASQVRKVLKTNSKLLTTSQEKDLRATITIGVALTLIPKRKWKTVLQNAEQWATKNKQHLTNQ